MYYFFFFFVLIYNKVIPIFTAQFNRPTSTYLSNFLLLVNSHNIPWPAYPSRIIYLDRYLPYLLFSVKLRFDGHNNNNYVEKFLCAKHPQVMATCIDRKKISKQNQS